MTARSVNCWRTCGTFDLIGGSESDVRQKKGQQRGKAETDDATLEIRIRSEPAAESGRQNDQVSDKEEGEKCVRAEGGEGIQIEETQEEFGGGGSSGISRIGPRPISAQKNLLRRRRRRG